MIAAAPDYPADDTGWIPVCERFPEVKIDTDREFIVSYTTFYSRKVKVGMASYLNKMLVPDEDEYSEESEIILTGWFDTEINEDGDMAYQPLNVIGWMEKPAAMTLPTAPEGAGSSGDK